MNGILLSDAWHDSEHSQWCKSSLSPVNMTRWIFISRQFRRQKNFHAFVIDGILNITTFCTQLNDSNSRSDCHTTDDLSLTCALFAHCDVTRNNRNWHYTLSNQHTPIQLSYSICISHTVGCSQCGRRNACWYLCSDVAFWENIDNSQLFVDTIFSASKKANEKNDLTVKIPV